jgi:hypothetical protein
LDLPAAVCVLNAPRRDTLAARTPPDAPTNTHKHHKRARRYHSGPPKEGWGYAWPNTGGTRVVDVRNVAGFTPLHYAVWVGRRDAILALASYDASLTVTNIANDFEWIKGGWLGVQLWLRARAWLLQATATSCACTAPCIPVPPPPPTNTRARMHTVGTGNTPLHLAAYGGDFDVVKLLLAGYVQSLAAGPQVMTARHGQWGERHLGALRVRALGVDCC